MTGMTPNPVSLEGGRSPACTCTSSVVVGERFYDQVERVSSSL